MVDSVHSFMHWLKISCSNNIVVHIMVPLYGICMLMNIFVLPGEMH